MLIILKKVTISALGLAALLPLVGAEWRVESPLPGILELANDGNQWGGLNPFDVLPCNGSGCIAKKEFPLDKLPAGSLEKADKVYLKLHIGVFDQSTELNPNAPNGLTERFRISFDGGGDLVLSTSDPRLPARSATSNRLNDWIEIPIDKSLLLNRDRIAISVAKVDDGDDFIYPSVDRSVENTASSVSRDGGKNWSRDWNREQNQPCGEFMMRLKLADTEEQTASWRVDSPRPGVLELANDNNSWGGLNPFDVLPCNGPGSIAAKVFPLTKLPAGSLEKADKVYLKLHIGVFDYSTVLDREAPNGLTERFRISFGGGGELVLNTSDPRLPARSATSNRLNDWVEIPIDKSLLLNREEISISIAKVDDGDDFIYPGIDRSVKNTASSVSRDGGKSWSRDWNREQNQHCGEFMMRLKLSSVGEQGTAEWTAGNGIVGDPEQLFAYAADEGELFRLELRRHWDESRPLTLAFATEPDAEFSAVDEKGAAVAFTRSGNTLSFNTGVPFAVECRNGRVRSVKASFAPAREWPAARPDMTPEVNAPAGARTGVAPSCRIDNSTAILENEAIRAEFQLAPALALKSLFCAEVNRNILKAADETRIFRIHAGGRTYDARDGKVTSVKPLSNGFQAVVLLEEPGLECTVSVIAERDELRFKLDVVNRGESGADFALAFPHLDGITLSAKPEDDFYLFPFGGGIIGGENCHFRSAYGQNDAWWQMVDLFSRTSGGGVYLRGDDPDASYKFLNLRKGKGVKHPDLYHLCTGTTPGFFESDHHWPHALSEGDYAGMAIDYAERPCAPSVKVTLPDAVIGTHAGNWKAAMQRYADWAAGVWPRQAFPGKLTGQWNYRAGMGLGSPLWKDGKYDTSYQGKHHKRPADIWELCSWWTLSRSLYWKLPFEEIGRFAKDPWVEKVLVWRDPATGEKVLSYALGDYDGYNPQWGGLPAFRQHIRDLKNADQVALLYYDAVLMDASAKNAKMVPEFAVINHQYKCAPAHDVANPTTPPGIVAKYHQYAMCVNAEKFADYTIDDVVRVVEETGVDGVRLDEFGGGGHLCFSTMHSHIFSNEGWGNPVLQAVAYITRGIREKLGRSGKEVLLLTEFPGHDMLVSTLDGALCYDSISRRSFARPAQINLLRFYFRNCKLFEIIEDAGDHKPAPWDLWLWNAVGVYNSGEYPDHIRSLLLDNNDAFDLGELEPLVDTVCDGVYANRFTSGRKRIWTLFNAAGHTVDRPLLKPEGSGDIHYVELTTGRELALRDGLLSCRLRPQSTIAIAEYPRLISLKDGKLQAKEMPAGAKLVASDADGRKSVELTFGAPLPDLAGTDRIKLVGADGIVLDIRHRDSL
ncbi:hypothetical protein KH017_06660 [bacterium]|nr:hypothetical protein [bacterium]